MYHRESDYEDFSIVLFSNDSMDFYPENLLSSFTNKLNYPCNLENGSWYVGLSEISFNDFSESGFVNDEQYSDSGLDLCCIPKKRQKRANFSTSKIKIDITSDESIEFSYKDLVDVLGVSHEIGFDTLLKNLDTFVVKLDTKPIDEVKLVIRKQFDDWLVEFQKNSGKRSIYKAQGNRGSENTCIIKLGNEKINLSFPGDYKNLNLFLDYIILQIDTDKRSFDKLESFFDIFLVYNSVYKQSKNHQVLVPQTITNIAPDTKLQNAHKNLIAAVNPKTNTSSQSSNQPILQATNPTITNDNPDGYMFVYLDIISPRRIGSRNNRVLKVFRCEKKTFHFTNIEYVKLEKNNFDSLSILLCNSGGEKVNFTPSKIPTYVNLHFKHVTHF